MIAHTGYWEVHGFFFLLGLLFFPRITILFFSNVAYGICLFFGILAFPRIIIAILAAYSYWDTNPILVIIAFMFCLAGEAAEKAVIKTRL